MAQQIGDVAGQGAWPADAGYAADAPPVFIGHCRMDGEPEPLAPNLACLDYSAAKPVNKLVALPLGWGRAVVEGKVRLRPNLQSG